MKLKKEHRNALMAIGIAVVAVILLVPGLLPSLGALVTGTVNFCDATPFDAKCICPTGEQKVFSTFTTWACEPTIPPATSYSFPLQTWEEARAFAEEQLNGIGCESPYALSSPQSGLIDYSRQLDLISLECRSPITTMTGQMVWELYVDPIDGYVYKRFCNEALVEGCPADIPFTPK